MLLFIPLTKSVLNHRGEYGAGRRSHKANWKDMLMVSSVFQLLTNLVVTKPHF